jgi:uncharacterized protein (DUF362 family)
MSIYVETGVTRDNKRTKLRVLLNRARLFPLLWSRSMSIVIKVNLAPASQVAYRYYTDPALVNALCYMLRSRGFNNLQIVEAETNFAMAYPELTPDRIAPRLGYENPVTDLTTTATKTVFFKNHPVKLSRIMLDADFIINFPKAKNHDLMLMTCCLKNMYGSIPDPNKWRLFHKKESGLSIAEVTHLVNAKTPPNFNLVDFVEGIDGDEVSLFKQPITAFKYYPSHMLVAGIDPFYIDKYIALKMGYEQNESPIVAYEAEQRGDLDVRDIDLIGGNFRPLSKWRKISWGLNAKAKLQDKLPISDATVSAGLKMYHFDFIKHEDE